MWAASGAMMMRSRSIVRSLLLAALAVMTSSGVYAEERTPPPHAQSPVPAPVLAPVPAQIDRNGVLILIRSTLIALDQANRTGNYTVLRDLGAPEFQVNSDARLADIFAGHRRDNMDLSGVAVLDPQLTVMPQIEANGMMRMAGFFPSVPTQVNFELLYAPVNRQWRLFGLSVSLGQASPVAPSPPPAPPPKPAAPEARVTPRSATAKASGSHATQLPAESKPTSEAKQ